MTQDAPLRAIEASGAPAAIGPYSQAIVAGGFVFCSGQLPLDPVSGAMVEGDIGAQTRRIMRRPPVPLAEARPHRRRGPIRRALARQLPDHRHRSRMHHRIGSA